MDHQSPLTMLSPVLPNNLTRKDVEALRKFKKRDTSKRDIKHILADVVAGRLILWKWHTLYGQGLIGTSVVDRGPNYELFLDVLCGTGYITLRPFIIADLKTIAKEHKCTTLGAATKSPALLKIALGTGWKEQAVYGTMEL